MKSILKSLSLIILASLALLSCSKEYEPISDPNNGLGVNPFLGELSCTFWGGDGFYSNERRVFDVTDENGIRSLTIEAKQYSDSLDPTAYRMLNLAINNFNGPGDYAVGSATMNTVTISYSKDNIHFFNQISNVPETFIHVSKADGTNYEGTFQFNASNITDPNATITVTNGQFKLTK